MSQVREFALPDLGEGLTESEIHRWLVAVGDVVTQNQPIVEVETAKAVVEIPAMWAGRVSAIFHGEGETVLVGTPIIAIDTQSGDQPQLGGPPPNHPPSASTAPSAPQSVEPQPAAGAPGSGRTAVLVGYGPREPATARRPRKGASPTAPTALPATGLPAAPAAVGQALAKPPVRRLARDLGIDLYGLTGSGPAGSITREDVHRARPQPVGAAPGFGPERERRIPVKGVRRLIAENMVASAFTAPHVTEFLTVDATRAMRALDRLRELPEWRGVRLSPLLLVTRAVLLAIARHPNVNATWAGDDIVVKEYVNLGLAAATERGLIVPNLKDAGRLSLRELADAMAALVETARQGRTSLADLTGGTFTITNVGVFGIDAGTPILPPGEAAILAFGAVREAPWVHRGKVKVRQVTTLSLSFDHRIIDGELGSLFLRDVGGFLTDPAAALLAWG